MQNLNVKSLRKFQLFALPGLTHNAHTTVRQLKQQLNNKLNELNLNWRGIKVHQKIRAFNEQQAHDDAPFERLTNEKRTRREKIQRQHASQQSIKQAALDEQAIMKSFMNINAKYNSTKSAERRYYMRTSPKRRSSRVRWRRWCISVTLLIMILNTE